MSNHLCNKHQYLKKSVRTDYVEWVWANWLNKITFDRLYWSNHNFHEHTNIKYNEFKESIQTPDVIDVIIKKYFLQIEYLPVAKFKFLSRTMQELVEDYYIRYREIERQDICIMTRCFYNDYDNLDIYSDCNWCLHCGNVTPDLFEWTNANKYSLNSQVCTCTRCWHCNKFISNQNKWWKPGQDTLARHFDFDDKYLFFCKDC